MDFMFVFWIFLRCPLFCLWLATSASGMDLSLNNRGLSKSTQIFLLCENSSAMIAGSLVFVKLFCTLFFSSRENMNSTVRVERHCLESVVLEESRVECGNLLHLSIKHNGPSMAVTVPDVRIKMHSRPKGKVSVPSSTFLGCGSPWELVVLLCNIGVCIVYVAVSWIAWNVCKPFSK